MPLIEIIINPKGHSQVQTTGFEGAACRSSSHFIERALGTTTNEQLTSEFHTVSIGLKSIETERP